MKRYLRLIKSSMLMFAKVLVPLCSMLFFLCSCMQSQEITYYSEKENFISVTGTVSSIGYNEDSTVLYIDVAEMSPALDDTCFKIVGENLKIVQSMNIGDKLNVGVQITFITAPKYFGDGYVMPIVAITIDGKAFLEFEEGHKNLLNWLSE